ncbi:unnamed protein product [Pedinophyceae sp. YPF-701]|nr:unnamed protein product [Pedinophyceae sp. YPF-701]
MTWFKKKDKAKAGESKDEGKATSRGAQNKGLSLPPDLDPSNAGAIYSSALLKGQFGPLTAAEYKQRLTTSGGVRSWYLPNAGYTVKYAYVSQRGLYPDKLDKANQDALCAHVNFADDGDQLLFGVFDGHGEHGTPCAQYAMQRVPMLMKQDPELSKNPHVAFFNAFVNANEQMHQSNIDDTMSGTTGICVLVRGRRIYVANVGDSRAIISEQRPDGTHGAQDLSSDQTPFRRDEIDRVRQCGAVVLTLDQLEGIKDPTIDTWTNEYEDDGDPPRLWLPHSMYPGTAFTRSLGDAIAERIGVFAEPEVLIKKLTPRNKLVIIASDGVFEFLPSQSVIDMATKFADPEEAALSIVAESYRLWLQHETRTDDITIIVLQIEGLVDDGAEEDDVIVTNQTVHGGDAALGLLEPAFPPVLGSAGEELTVDVQALRSSRTESEVDMLEGLTRGNFVLAALSPEEREAVYSVVQRQRVKAGEAVINQGGIGDCFYVVKSGEFDVYVSPAPGEEPEKVYTYLVDGGEHPSFGELGLLYGKPRAAMVVAATEGELLYLQRAAFKAVLASLDLGPVLQALRKVDLLSCLMPCEVQLLADLMQSRTFEPGQAIVRQGEVGDSFSIILDGEVAVTVARNANEEPKQVLTMGRFQYFGERALLQESKRAANVIAVNSVTVLEVSRADVEEHLGPLKAMAEQHKRWQAAVAAAAKKVPGPPPTPLTAESLSAHGTLWAYGDMAVRRYEQPGTGSAYLVRATAMPAGFVQVPVLKGRDAHQAVPVTALVPREVAVLKTSRAVMEVVDARPLCTLQQLAQQQPQQRFDEKTVQYVAASLVTALESCHRCGVVYRGLSTDTVVVSEEGVVQLCEFRHAKRIHGRTYTMCGSPEFMAPEMLEMRGHTEAVDWWALGVLVFCMTAGTSPFLHDTEDELQLYYNIIEGSMLFPPAFPAVTRTLVEGLMQMDPVQRLGHGNLGHQALKQHKFFDGVDWEKIAEGTHPLPADLFRAMEDFTGLAGSARQAGESGGHFVI